MNQNNLLATFSIILIFNNFIFSQTPDYQDPYSLANGGICVTNSNLWCFIHNPAGLALLSSAGVGSYYHNRFLLKETATKNLAFVIPNKFGNLGASINYFGYNSLNILNGNIAYGHFLTKKLAAGVKLEYNSLNSYEEIKPKQDLGYGISINYFLSEKVLVGLGLSKLPDFNKESVTHKKLSLKYLLGFRFQLTKNVFLLTESEKPPQNAVKIKIATEYKMNKSIMLNTGISTQPFAFSFGFGINYKSLLLYTASSWHQKLGFSPAISIQYQF